MKSYGEKCDEREKTPFRTAQFQLYGRTKDFVPYCDPVNEW